MSASSVPRDVASLVRYTHWAHDRILGAMCTAEVCPGRAVKLFGHILRAQDIWYGRVEDTDHANLDLWADDDLAGCADWMETSTGRWRRLLGDRETDMLDRPISYTNSKGTRFETPLRDILHHVVNHGTHHRAQIALILREAGIPPPATDYIFFRREG